MAQPFGGRDYIVGFQKYGGLRVTKGVWVDVAQVVPFPQPGKVPGASVRQDWLFGISQSEAKGAFQTTDKSRLLTSPLPQRFKEGGGNRNNALPVRFRRAHI